MKARQKGMALVISMVILVLAILLGLSSVNAALFEERMTGNYRFSISALQASEAGVKDIISYVRATYGPSSPPGCPVSGVVVLDDPVNVSYSSSGGLDRDYNTKLVCEDGEVVGYSQGRVYRGTEALSAREVRVVVIPPGESEVEGMLAGGNIDINGQSTIVGNVHANGDVDITGVTDATIGYVTAHGQVTSPDRDVEYSDTGECTTVICASSGVEAMSVPSAAAAIVEEMNAILGADYSALSEINADVVAVGPSDTAEYQVLGVVGGECSLNLSGDQSYAGESKRFYCPGALNLSGSFNGAVVMASGDITHGGSSDLGVDMSGESKVDTYIVSGGSITLNGNDDSYAAYHADGNITQNGDSTIYGSIVAGGGIRRAGGIDFEAMNSGFIMVPVSGFIDEWYELETPSA